MLQTKLSVVKMTYVAAKNDRKRYDIKYNSINKKIGWKSPPSSDEYLSHDSLHHSSHDCNFSLGEQD